MQCGRFAPSGRHARSAVRALGGVALVLALSLSGAIYAGAVSADTLRCGNKLVSTGDTLYDVRGRCGEPAHTTRRVEYRTVSGWGPGLGAARTVEIVIDEWTYDFGPRKFVQHLIFEQGRLVAVVAGHRGQGKPQ